jgi:MFS family permease
MVNVALPTLAEDFDVPTTDIEWIAVGYLLALAAVIPAAGWLGDRFGTRRVFITALVVFVAMSLLCAGARSLQQLIGLRVLQGLGGGLLVPVGSAMLYRAFPMEDRAKAAIGVLSVAVIAPAIGPMLAAKGVLFAGLDVIGDYLTEVNVTSPTGIREIDKQFGISVADELIAAIEARLDQ